MTVTVNENTCIVLIIQVYFKTSPKKNPLLGDLVINSPSCCGRQSHYTKSVQSFLNIETRQIPSLKFLWSTRPDPNMCATFLWLISGWLNHRSSLTYIIKKKALDKVVFKRSFVVHNTPQIPWTVVCRRRELLLMFFSHYAQICLQNARFYSAEVGLSKQTPKQRKSYGWIKNRTASLEFHIQLVGREDNLRWFRWQEQNLPLPRLTGVRHIVACPTLSLSLSLSLSLLLQKRSLFLNFFFFAEERSQLSPPRHTQMRIQRPGNVTANTYYLRVVFVLMRPPPRLLWMTKERAVCDDCLVVVCDDTGHLVYKERTCYGDRCGLQTLTPMVSFLTACH